MQGPGRRLVHVVLYELIALLLLTTLFQWHSAPGLVSSTALGVLTSALAMLWNLLFNLLFERWEAGQARRGRSLRRRLVHALGFEGGLVLLTLPLFAWWLQLSLLDALLLDLGLTLVFLVYTLVFNWAFDRLFGLPQAAR